MSTRSAQNKRTQAQLQGERSGMARRSTSSAKPARPAAGSVRTVATSGKAKRKQLEQGEDLSGLSREEKKARKAQRRMQEDRIYTAQNALMKQDPEYIKHRRRWYAMLALGIICIVIAWALMALNGGETTGVRELVVVGLSYAFIIGAFIFDFVKIRPIRNACRSVAEGMSDSKLNSVIEREAKAEDDRRAAREAKKLARKEKGSAK